MAGERTEHNRRIQEALEAADRYKAQMDAAVASGDADALGDALAGWVFASTAASIGVMSRPGVTFTDEQKALIEQRITDGDTAGAQRAILDRLAEADADE